MKPRTLLLVITLFVIEITLNAQIPYFSGTAGNGNLYGYTSLKIRPGMNAQETYSCFQYGIGNHLVAGTDIYTTCGSAYWGFLARAGKVISPYFGVGVQLIPSFNLNYNFKYSYTTVALYMNGQIIDDGKLFWCTNTWWGINKEANNTIFNWEYIGYSFCLPKERAITPMLGCLHSLTFDQAIDIAVGAYYSVGKWNFYLWGNDLLKDNPRIVVGIDFKLPMK